ncbi:MAG TPA: YraN family protein [Longimicrobiaceae bacterium]|nr:YraN family protein [Longimicrobiaceae bacterium]
MRTEQQRAGDAAEDLVGIDPGPPACLVVIEVRWRRERAFGLPEESFDRRKQGRLRRACGGLLARGLPDGTRAGGLPVRVDLVVVEPPLDGGGPRIRHHRHALGA